MITQAELKALLTYDPLTGLFTWNRTSGKAIAGAVAGSVKASGYRTIGIAGRVYKAHRLAWLYMTGSWPSEEIDHCNTDTDDNRWENLREATRSQNNANRNTNNPLGRGVHPNGNGYRACIKVHGKLHHLGTYAKPEDAQAAYAMAARKFFGEFART